MSFEFDDFKVQGVKFNYYFICKRKLWLFSNGISMEERNERVNLGKLIHEDSYKTKNKEILIDNMIKLDILEEEKVREVKITSRMMESDRLQLQYYLYYLKKLGINKTGTLNYVKEKRVEEVILDKETEKFIEETLVNIREILKMSFPPKVEKYKYCKKCAYYEFCYIREVY
ncbi:MAG: CRISPR-associated protein Cas4 [Clostridium sp.]|uniref:CRISPR-associated protein Cas4 n=1 Tax=Clostridium sp. TaxID=1506 RepID=UPI003F3140F8